jgi:response regulator RpfG family c-di-GMP phosphodiesterase
MLKLESFNVYTTDLGEEGVDLGKLYDYDIILLDINLPHMFGYKLRDATRISSAAKPHSKKGKLLLFTAVSHFRGAVQKRPLFSISRLSPQNAPTCGLFKTLKLPL